MANPENIAGCGFHRMSKEMHRAVSSVGGKTTAARRHGHPWTPEQARNYAVAGAKARWAKRDAERKRLADEQANDKYFQALKGTGAV